MSGAALQALPQGSERRLEQRMPGGRRLALQGMPEEFEALSAIVGGLEGPTLGQGLGDATEVQRPDLADLTAVLQPQVPGASPGSIPPLTSWMPASGWRNTSTSGRSAPRSTTGQALSGRSSAGVPGAALFNAEHDPPAGGALLHAAMGLDVLVEGEDLLDLRLEQQIAGQLIEVL